MTTQPGRGSDEPDEDEDGAEGHPGGASGGDGGKRAGGAGGDGDDDADDDDDDGEEGAAELPASTVFVATATPLQVSVGPLPDDRAPDGVCLASRIDGRLVARCAMPGESIDRLMELKLFEEPVLIGLLAYEGEPGIQGRLVALVPATRLTESNEENEPWKASVPSFEQAQRTGRLGEAEEGDEPADDAEGSGLAAVLLGHIVRFDRDRKHRDDLAREAVDILQRVVSGTPLSDAAAKAIDDLLGSL